MSAVFMELPGGGRALTFQQRGCASTLLMVQHMHWLPPFLVTAESWGNGKMSPPAAAAALYATCSSLSGMMSGAQLSASTISLPLQWLPWWDVSRAFLSLVHPCSCGAVPSPGASRLPGNSGAWEGEQGWLREEQCCLQVRV